MNSIVCTICQEAGHRLDRCPTLAAPLQPGFQGGGGGGHGHADDQEERLKVPVQAPTRCPRPLVKFLKTFTWILP